MTYSFESKNRGTVEISVVGEYDGYEKDLYVTGEDFEKAFDEIDAGSADEILQYLVDEGVEFESKRNAAFLLRYIQSVMLDEDTTQYELLASADKWTDEKIADILQFVEF